jgi:hypothetical protein
MKITKEPCYACSVAFQAVVSEQMATCDMVEGCADPVTHIGNKGYVYCAKHAAERRATGYERTRAMRLWEKKLIAAGEPIPKY